MKRDIATYRCRWDCANMLHAIACLLVLVTRATANVYVYTMDTPHTIAQDFPDMPATFGGEVPLTGLRGLLVQGEPEDGCSALPPPPQVTDNFTGKWIVLLARFNCSFELKIRNAQAAGYDCAIVHNVNSSDLETMSAKNPDGIVIPSTFVSDLSGQELAEAYLYNYGHYYIMLDGISPYNINSLLVPFAVVVVLCLIVILIFMIIKCIKDRRRARRHRLPNRFLKKIPTCKFSKGDPYDTCAICLDDYQEGERLRVLPCAHAYHSKCIDPWLTQNRRVCPVCKRRVLAAGEPRARPHSDSDSDTEPLLADTHSNTHPTQGGTFDEQRENPFVRAVRHMMRLREQHEHHEHHDAERAQPSEETEQTNNDNVEDNAQAEETQPLVARPARRSERRTRRERRRQNASINSETRGEIGVAALPVSPAEVVQRMIL